MDWAARPSPRNRRLAGTLWAGEFRQRQWAGGGDDPPPPWRRRPLPRPIPLSPMRLLGSCPRRRNPENPGTRWQSCPSGRAPTLPDRSVSSWFTLDVLYNTLNCVAIRITGWEGHDANGVSPLPVEG